VKFARYILAALFALSPIVVAAQNGPNATYNALSVRTVTATQAITATSFAGPLAGNAATASKLFTARTLSITGDGTATLTFDGSANATAALTLAPAGRAHLGAASSGVNADITQLTGLTQPITIAQGGTTATAAPQARINLGAATAGANSDITSVSGLTTPLSAAQGGTGNNGGAWTTYTPTVSATSGNPTGVFAGRWRQIGKTVFISINLQITANNGGTTPLIASLPLASTSASVAYSMLSGRANVNTGKGLTGVVRSGTSQVEIYNYDNTYPASNGELVTVTGTYEVQ
jgi:hypothetical protein